MWTKACACSTSRYRKCSRKIGRPFFGARLRESHMPAGNALADLLRKTQSRSHMPLSRRLLLGCALICAAAFGSHAEDGVAIHWAPLADAQVKVDDKTPLTWAVYQPEKKDKKDKKNGNLVLTLVGHRYLLIDLKAESVYEVPLTELHKQGDAFDTGDLPQTSREIPVTDWTSRDVGPAELFEITLGDYGRTLKLQLSHPPDLRAFY